jgi:isopentenyl-diphosphate delta-isomerase
MGKRSEPWINWMLAFSIFIFNTKGELLLQQRAPGKYHSGLLWTNTCCSHPRPGENIIDAAYRRLQEEMGIHCVMDDIFNFTYKAAVSDTLTEHELDHVFFGVSDEPPVLAISEVNDFKYINMELLAHELNLYPEQYTPWLSICFSKVMEHYHKLFNYQII